MPLVFDEEVDAPPATGGSLVFDDEPAGKLVFDDEPPAQPLPETAWNTIKRGFLDLAAKPIQAIGNVQRNVDEMLGFKAPFMLDLRKAGDFMGEVGAESERLRPVDPRNKWTAGIASAVPTVMGLAATGGMAGAPAALTQAGLMGAQSGFETADEIGVKSPAGKLATAAGFGLAEAGIEALGGLGAKPVIGSALKRFAKTAGSEAIEEPLTGGAQDLVTRMAATEDPTRPGFTATGYDLAQLNLNDPRYWQKRALEAAIGAAGGALAGGIAAGAGGQGLVAGEAPPTPNPQPPTTPSIESGESIVPSVDELNALGPAKGIGYNGVPLPPDGLPPPVVGQPLSGPQSPTPNPQPPIASVTPQAAPVPIPAAQAQAPVLPATAADAGSTPAAGASVPLTLSDLERAVQQAYARVLEPGGEAYYDQWQSLVRQRNALRSEQDAAFRVSHQPPPTVEPERVSSVDQEAQRRAQITAEDAADFPDTVVPGVEHFIYARSKDDKMVEVAGPFESAAAAHAARSDAWDAMPPTLQRDTVGFSYGKRSAESPPIPVATAAAEVSSPETTAQPPPTTVNAAPQPSTATPSPSGPGAASSSEYQPTTTLKDSVARFKAIGADDPFLYRASPEQELDDLARTVIDEDARGLPAVTNDLLTQDSGALGLTEREHAALLGHAMWRWATQPASEAQTAHIKAIREVLKPVGSRGGQLLQVFDYIKRLDPEFRLDETFDAAETKRAEAITTATGMTEAEMEAEIARRVNEELAKLPPQIAQSPQAGIRNRAKMTVAEKAAKKLMDSLKGRNPRIKHGHVTRMVKAWMDAVDAGIADRADFRAAFEKAFNVPKGIPPKLAADLRAKAVKARALPQGSSERLALEKDIEDDLAIHSGLNIWDLVKAGWYQNILSGLGFQWVNLVGSVQNMSTTLVQGIGDALAGNPASLIKMLRGGWTGLVPAYAGLRNTLSTGRAYKGGEKYGDVSASELTARGWEQATPAQKAVYHAMAQGVTRRLARFGAGVDVFFNSLNREAAAQMAAARKLHAQGLRYGTPEYKVAFAKELGFDGTKWADAMTRAAAALKADGKPVTMRELKRRALEEAERNRDPALAATSHRLADRVTYQQDPEGSGEIMSGIIKQIQRVPIAGTLLTPFNKIVSNFMSENLDWAGVGLLRGAFGTPVSHRYYKMTGQNIARPVQYEATERRERALKSVIGLSLAYALVEAMKAHLDKPDDDEMPLMFYGKGPEGRNERAVWLAAGNKPYSFRIGKRVVPYSETVLFAPLAIAGTYMDAKRYGTLKDTPAGAARLAYGALKAAQSIAHFGPLASVKKGFDFMEGRVSKTDALISASGVKGLVPAAALLRDIEQTMDPRKTDDTTIAGSMMEDIPGLSSFADLKLNRFGEADSEVGLPGIRRIAGTTPKIDPAVKFMLKHDLTMPGAADVTRVADDFTFPDDPALNLDRIYKLHLTRAEERIFRQESGRVLKEGILRLKNEAAALTESGQPPDPKLLQKHVQVIDKAAEMMGRQKLIAR